MAVLKIILLYIKIILKNYNVIKIIKKDKNNLILLVMFINKNKNRDM